MNTKTLFPIVSCIIFIGVIWTMTNIYSDFLTVNLSEIKTLQEKERITQSFASQKSPEQLSKRISEFAPDILDKAAITSEFSQFARESNIEISSISISIDDKIAKIKNINIDEDGNVVGDTNTSDMINTLKSANIILQVDGGKREIYAFLEKLTQSNRYIEINTVNLSFARGLDNVGGNINAITYYK
jgi:hypothetical protein